MLDELVYCQTTPNCCQEIALLFPFFIFFVFAILILVGGYYSAKAAKKRREGVHALGQQLGLSYRGGNDYSFDERYPFIRKLCQGKNRYGFNVLQGTYRDHPVYAFDYHYTTKSRDKDGKTKTHHHYFSFFILHFNGNFPELLICREGFFSKLSQFFGFDDIDFESAEFSRQFLVRSPNKKFAYDICHSGMIEYLMENRDLSIEIERDVLTLFFPRRLEPGQIKYNLDRLVRVRELFPNYIFDPN